MHRRISMLSPASTHSIWHGQDEPFTIRHLAAVAYGFSIGPGPRALPAAVCPQKTKLRSPHCCPKCTMKQNTKNPLPLSRSSGSEMKRHRQFQQQFQSLSAKGSAFNERVECSQGQQQIPDYTELSKTHDALDVLGQLNGMTFE